MSEGFDAVWRKSSRSSEQGHCVEIAQNMPGVGAVRDSKAPGQPPLVFRSGQVRAFLRAVKAGRLDR
ncbi:DUF397 domain-containing protein [Allosaccharopolyspora coralli]|uniref:DUF397 domain-containing protein n=1 Tax=Allosaccharopolyspora coralli TaxID=2665642 RepID=A0A5Q3QCZ5_9PSEU|nr:DUF397 domain-containing protein [Allosaccharopolyspora coralli]QGK69419.1 DUF397 domain-containing protein [Allosaccharopolyspora coralli]